VTFGAAGFLLTAAWFLPGIIRSQDPLAFLLYVGLPGIAAAAAGAVLRAPILDATRMRTPAEAAFRGAVVGSVAILLFAPMFALVFTWTAPGRSTLLGLTAAVLIFAALAVWWLVVMIGALLGWLLFWLASRSVPEALPPE
jgi:hypothetical protein